MAADQVTRDQNIYRELEPLQNGFVPAVRRRWMYVGFRYGVQCRFECELETKHPSVPDTYKASAVFAHNVHYLCNDWVKLADLEPITTSST